LANVTEGYERMMSGKARFRVVLAMRAGKRDSSVDE
jgi:D-arabinose 1-dehydrogenase-like Zn-dependent alcohol dehydrogenase